MQSECKNNWRWVIGILIVVFGGIATVVYASSSANRDEISSLESRVSKQEAILQRVESNTDEMKRDIKVLIEKR